MYWGWFEEIIIVCLIQKYIYDLIDGTFIYWTQGERK
jgi:hypothetical protein